MKRVLLLFIFLSITYFALSQDKKTEYQKLARDVFKELIEINTTSGYGSTKALHLCRPYEMMLPDRWIKFLQLCGQG